MLSNPLTPPQEFSAGSNSNVDHIVILNPFASEYSDQQFATPVSNANMGLEGQDERQNMDDNTNSYDISDDEQDSSGGAELVMTVSHAEQLNAELDTTDGDITGSGNLAGLHMDENPNAHFNEYVSYSNDEHMEPDFDHGTHYPENPEGYGPNDFPEPAQSFNLPTTMSAVSLQLQQMQDGQGHIEFMGADDMHIDTNNSITSILLPLFSSVDVSLFGSSLALQADHVSLAQISPLNHILASANSTTISHFGALQDWTSLPSAGAMVSTQGQPTFFQFNSADVLDNMSDADDIEVEDQYNATLGDFLYDWGTSVSQPEDTRKHGSRGPVLAAVRKQRLERPMPVRRNDLQGERCDIQRINWEELGVTRLEAKLRRRRSYKNYSSVMMPREEPHRPRMYGRRSESEENFFRFRSMDFDHNVHLAHFQLRNLVACASRDHVFYAGKSKVMHWNPNDKKAGSTTAMDLTNPEVQPMYSYAPGVQISTITVGENILVAGGFHGEYAIQNLGAHKDTKHTEGMITEHMNSITNHVQVHQSRSSTSPIAVFASNDNGVRLLDINTNTFIAEHIYEPAINCTAISPDQRLRVLVGDTANVMICRSDTGEILQSLDGHRDFGFACDWADDGWTVATGNQDMQVMIWDARMWTDSSGKGRPIATIAAEMAGVRKVKFSPIGSGKRVLLAAEPADVISVIDGDLFNSKQTLSFFGEIGGLDFTNNGQDLIVANTDSMRGGLMEFERCDFGGRGLYSLDTFKYPARRQKRQRRPYKDEEIYDWKATDDDVIRHPKSRGNLQQRQAKAANLGTNMGYF